MLQRSQFIVNIILIIAYAIAVHISIILQIPTLGLSVLALLLLNQIPLYFFRKHLRYACLFSISIIAFYIFLIHTHSNTIFYLPPIIITALLFWLFTSSLLPSKTALITNFVSKIYDVHYYPILRYTRNITKIWAVFFALLLIENIFLMMFADKEIWSLFCNILNYVFIGALYTGESIYRNFRFGQLVHGESALKKLFRTPLQQLMNMRTSNEVYYDLLGHQKLSTTFAIVDGNPVTCANYLYDVNQLKSQLNDSNYLINLCRNRYYFTVVLGAALLSKKILLLPHNDAPQTITDLKVQYPQSQILVDNDLNINTERNNPAWQTSIRPRLAKEQLAVIAFTSGSTGTPTQWHHYWGDLVTHAHDTAAGLKLKPRQTYHVIATVPSQHMYGLEHVIIMPMQRGDKINSKVPFYAADIKLCAEENSAPTILLSTPLHLRICTQMEAAPKNLVLIVSATACLDEELAREIETALDTPLVEIYGCTEAGAIATRRTTKDLKWHLLRNSHLHLENGQIFLQRCTTYTKVQQRILLSDQLQLCGSNKFLFIARNNEQLNIAGKRISLTELNQKLCQIDGVEDGTFLLPKITKTSIERLIVFIIANSTISNSDIMTTLRKEIPTTFLPRRIIRLKQLPRTTIGKTDMQQLRKIYSDHGDN